MRTLLLLLTLGSPFAYAVKPIIVANVFYFTDNFTYEPAPASQYKRIMYDLSVGMPITKKGQIVLGWNYASYAFSETTSSETSLKVTDMGRSWPTILIRVVSGSCAYIQSDH